MTIYKRDHLFKILLFFSIFIFQKKNNIKDIAFLAYLQESQKFKILKDFLYSVNQVQ